VVIAFAFVMKSQGLSLSQAYELVHSKRSIAIPNLGFLKQLGEYEEVLFQRAGKPWAKPSLTDAQMLEMASSHPGERHLAGVDRPHLEGVAINVSRMNPIDMGQDFFQGQCGAQV
jgi:hypothetical protein